MNTTFPKTSPVLKPILGWPPRRIFLFDALGALLTATILGGILPSFSETLGMSARLLYLLGGLALLFFVYSFLVFLIRPFAWVGYLQVIALANFSYCLLTLGLLWYWQDHLNPLAWVYFIGEALVIMGIAALEWGYAQQNSARSI